MTNVTTIAIDATDEDIESLKVFLTNGCIDTTRRLDRLVAEKKMLRDENDKNSIRRVDNLDEEILREKKALRIGESFRTKLYHADLREPVING